MKNNLDCQCSVKSKAFQHSRRPGALSDGSFVRTQDIKCLSHQVLIYRRVYVHSHTWSNVFVVDFTLFNQQEEVSTETSLSRRTQYLSL